jgi:hypothetical protein
MPQEIEFVASLPKTRSGKIVRRVLRAQEWGEPVGDPGGPRTAGIHVMNSDGTNPNRISTFGNVPAWSPDSARIAFHSNGIWIMNSGGSGAQ